MSVEGKATIHDFATILEGERLAGRVAFPQVTVLFSPDRIELMA